MRLKMKFGFSAIAGLSVLAAGCSDKPITMNGNLSGKLDGAVATTVKLEGPMQIQMQMQGPTIRYEGTNISDELPAEVKEGKTTDDWVPAVMGEPNARAELRDGTQIWRWTYRPVEQQGSVVEFFSKSEKEPKPATRTVFVQMRDGVVVRKWRG